MSKKYEHLFFELFFLQTLETCACSTELCNKNWADAGEQPDVPTDAPTEPAVKNVKVGEEDLAKS